MLKKLKNIKIHLMLFVFFLGLFLGMNLSMVSSAHENAFKYLDFFHYVYQTIKKDYVEKPDVKNLFEGAIGGLISSLDDPYSRYLNASAYAQFKQNVTGKFVGIGVEVSIKDKEFIIISAIDGTPAQKAGIQSGDIIVKVDNTEIKSKPFGDIVKKIKGKPGSSVMIHIQRKGFPELLKFNITRAPIKVASVKSGLIKESSGTGYIRVNHFYHETASDFEKALKSLKELKVKKIILDLRGNPGGDMESAIKMADMLLGKKNVIVTTKGRAGSGINENYFSKQDPLYSDKMMVLVDNGSASASEILSGALKDHKRARLMGRKTFGKALVQKLVDIDPDKTGFTLTIRKYYTPSGAMIHKKGIIPDIKTKSQIIPEKDRKNLSRVLNSRLIEEFSKDHKVYNKENQKKLMDFLKSKNLALSENVSNFYFKRYLHRLKKSPLYDIEFDYDLKKAIEVINE